LNLKLRTLNLQPFCHADPAVAGEASPLPNLKL